MVDADKFLKRLIMEKGNIFFSEIRYRRAVALRKSKKEYAWENIGYKIYPSSLKTLNMCPKNFVETDVHKPPGFEVPVVYKLELGKKIHSLYQDVAKDQAELLDFFVEDDFRLLDTYLRDMYKKEALGFGKLLYDRPRDLGPLLEAKLEKAWPEVPVWDEATGVSGRADLVLNKSGYPAILDLKTTSVAKDLWDVHTDKLPSDDHKLQVRIYRHMMNVNKYYPLPVCEIGLGYVNVLMEAGSEGSEVEKWEDMGEVPDEEVAQLFSHLKLQRDEWMKNKKTKPCTYEKCRVNH